MTQTAQLPLLFCGSTAAAFEEFHRANPAIYTTLVRLAREWVARTGQHKLGIATLFERTRWEIALETNDPSFKLNNSFRAYYARLIQKQESDLDGFFHLRTSAADSWIESVA
jgi:hypothetical protein